MVTPRQKMDYQNFLKYYTELSSKNKYKLIFLHRRQPVSWHDVYFQCLRDDMSLLKVAERKRMIPELIKDSKEN